MSQIHTSYLLENVETRVSHPSCQGQWQSPLLSWSGLSWGRAQGNHIWSQLQEKSRPAWSQRQIGPPSIITEGPDCKTARQVCTTGRRGAHQQPPVRGWARKGWARGEAGQELDVGLGGVKCPPLQIREYSRNASTHSSEDNKFSGGSSHMLGIPYSRVGSLWSTWA